MAGHDCLAPQAPEALVGNVQTKVGAPALPLEKDGPAGKEGADEGVRA